MWHRGRWCYKLDKMELGSIVDWICCCGLDILGSGVDCEHLRGLDEVKSAFLHLLITSGSPTHLLVEEFVGESD